eukprot:evm.model.scf_4811.1 EVM.evm.TU.scf_4811.1   scf_4811:242-3088(-)
MAGALAPRKFPRTPHLLNMGAATRDDLVLDGSETRLLLQGEVIVEEKVDGSNIGIGFDSEWRPTLQKRGHWVTPASEAQYAKLGAWLERHGAALAECIGQHRILFGEWLFAQHTVVYDKLPDWFLAFDIYDIGSESFLSRDAFDLALSGTGIFSVRRLRSCRFSDAAEVVELMKSATSAYALGDVPVEGVYIRREGNGRLLNRAKLVRPGFTQAIEDGNLHWSKKILVSNGIRSDLWGDPDEERGNLVNFGDTIDAGSSTGPLRTSEAGPSHPEDGVRSVEIAGCACATPLRLFLGANGVIVKGQAVDSVGRWYARDCYRNSVPGPGVLSNTGADAMVSECNPGEGRNREGGKCEPNWNADQTHVGTEEDCKGRGRSLLTPEDEKTFHVCLVSSQELQVGRKWFAKVMK